MARGLTANAFFVFLLRISILANFVFFAGFLFVFLFFPGYFFIHSGSIFGFGSSKSAF